MTLSSLFELKDSWWHFRTDLRTNFSYQRRQQSVLTECQLAPIIRQFEHKKAIKREVNPLTSTHMQTKHLRPGLLKYWYQTGKAAKICPSVPTLLIVSSTFSKVGRCGTLLAVLKGPCKRTHISQGRWDFWWRQNFNFSGPRESVLIAAAAFIASPPL